MPGNASNPFQSPQAAPEALQERGALPVPTFSRVLFIVDLVFCLLVLGSTILSFVVFFFAVPSAPQQQAMPSGMSLFLTGAGLVGLLLALVADVLGMQEKPQAVTWGVIAFGVLMVIRVAGVLHTLIASLAVTKNSEELAMMTAFFTVGSFVVTTAYNVLWLVAVLRFRQWLRAVGATVPVASVGRRMAAEAMPPSGRSGAE